MPSPLDDLLFPGNNAQQLYRALLAASKALELPVDVDRRLGELVAGEFPPEEVVDHLRRYCAAREGIADADSPPP